MRVSHSIAPSSGRFAATSPLPGGEEPGRRRWRSSHRPRDWGRGRPSEAEPGEGVLPPTLRKTGRLADMAHIQLKNITKTFGNHTALRDLDLDIADGEFFVLLGETGAGKTTTLRLIAGLEKPTDGQVFIDGVDVADWGAAERDVALVLQQYSLYPRYTVRENLEFPLKSKIRRVAGRRDRRARRRASPRRCASSICSTARPTGCRAARCSASRSAAPSCASRASS